MPSKTDHDSDAPERFTAKERDLIRREFMVRWGGYRPLSEGFLVYRWAGGPRKGTPKIGPTIQGMLDRGLVEIDDPEQGMPSARFTPAGFAALRAMARSAQMLSPKEYGHVLDQLEDLARPKRRRGRGPKAAEPAEPESPREPPGGPRPRQAAERAAKVRPTEVRVVADSAFQEAVEGLFAGVFDRPTAPSAAIIPFPQPAPAAKKLELHRGGTAPTPVCSFCWRSHRETDGLIEGHGGAYVCVECALAACELLLGE